MFTKAEEIEAAVEERKDDSDIGKEQTPPVLESQVNVCTSLFIYSSNYTKYM